MQIPGCEHAGGRLRPNELYLFNFDDPVAFQKFKQKYPNSVLAQTSQSWYISPEPPHPLFPVSPYLDLLKGKLATGELNELKPYPRICDFIPTGPTSGKLFAVEPSDYLSTWPIEAVWNEKKQNWTVKFPRNDDDRIPLVFKSEPVAIYSRGKSYYFVAKTGELHIAKNAKQDKRKMEQFLPKDHLITAVITDVDKDRLFAFGKDTKMDKKNHFFVELTEQAAPPKLQLFEPNQLPKVEGAEPMRTGLQFARFLAKQKKQ